MFFTRFSYGALTRSVFIFFLVSGFLRAETDSSALSDTVPAIPTAVSIRSSDTDTTVPTELDTLNVTAFRTGPVNSSIATISATEFQGKCTDLPAVLEQVSGVAVRRTGGFGEYSEASIRGSSPKQVQVYLDGIPLNSAAGGAVDLSKIPLTALRDITVYKGTAPLELMGSTAGTVIHLRTGAAKDISEGLFEIGSFGYRKAGTLFRKKTGSISHHFSVDYSAARNDYPFMHDNGTPYNDDDDGVKLKKHNAFGMIDLNYANDWIINERHRIHSGVHFNDERQELVRKLLVDSTQLTTHTAESFLGRITWEYTPTARWDMETRVEGRLKNSLFHDPLGQFYLQTPEKKREHFPLAALRYRLSGTLNDLMKCQILVRGGYEGYSSENLLAASVANLIPSARRLTGTAAGSYTISGKHAGIELRYNHVYVLDTANFKPSLESGKSLPRLWTGHFPNGNIDVFTEVNRHLTLDGSLRYEYLPVSLSDRYGWGNNYLGNPDLLPERRFEGSVGTSLQLGNVATSFSMFSGSTIDIIELQLQSQQIIMPFNTGNTLQTGLEWDLHVTPWPFLSIDNDCSVIYKKKVRKTSTGWQTTPLLFFSPVENDFRMTFSHRFVVLTHKLHYRSPFYTGYTASSDRESPAPSCDISLSVTPLPHITFTYRCENYLNVSYAPLTYYTPLPGRMHFFIGKLEW